METEEIAKTTNYWRDEDYVSKLIFDALKCGFEQISTFRRVYYTVSGSIAIVKDYSDNLYIVSNSLIELFKILSTKMTQDNFTRFSFMEIEYDDSDDLISKLTIHLNVLKPKDQKLGE